MAKAANGEGSIYAMKDGGYRGFVTLDGKRVYRKGRTIKAVRAALDEAKRQYGNTGTVGDSAITVKAFLTAWIEEAAPALKPETARKYRSHVDLHLVPRLGSKRLAALTPADVRRLDRDLVASGLSSTTAAHVHATLRRALNVALADGIVPRNVAALVPLPKRDTEEQQWLTPEEVRQLVAAVAGKPYEARVLVALLGLRQGEALGLGWDDVDLDNGTLTVRRSLSRTPEGLRLVEPKTSKSKRTIGLPAGVVEALRRHKVAQREHYLTHGIRPEVDLVFANVLGEPTEPGADWKHWRDALVGAGVRHVRLHDARHSFATAMLVAGADLKSVADALGHSSLGMLHTRYAHVADEMRDRTRNIASQALWGST